MGPAAEQGAEIGGQAADVGPDEHSTSASKTGPPPWGPGSASAAGGQVEPGDGDRARPGGRRPPLREPARAGGARRS